MGPHLGLGRHRHQLGHVAEGGAREIELVDLVLREIADAEFLRLAHRAGHRLQPAGEQLGQRRLAVAVGAEQRDAVVHVDADVEAAQHRLAGFVADIDALEIEQRRRQRVGGGEVEARQRLLDDGSRHFHLFQQLEPTLRLARLRGLVAEAVDEGLHVAALGELLLDGLRLYPLLFGAGLAEGVEIAAVSRQPATLYMHRPAGDAVEQVAVMADDDQRAAPVLEEIRQPDRRLDIEMVGWLVEQQQVGVGEQRRGQRHPHPPAAGQGAAGAVLLLGAEPEAGQDRRRPRGRGMGFDLAEPLMYLGEPVGIGMGFQFRFERGALGIGLQHGLDEGPLAVGRFLRDGGEAAAGLDRDRAGFRRYFAQDESEQGRLSGAIAADETHALAVGNRDGGILEDNLAGNPVGQVVDMKHVFRVSEIRSKPWLRGHSVAAINPRAVT